MPAATPFAPSPLQTYAQWRDMYADTARFSLDYLLEQRTSIPHNNKHVSPHCGDALLDEIASRMERGERPTPPPRPSCIVRPSEEEEEGAGGAEYETIKYGGKGQRIRVRVQP